MHRDLTQKMYHVSRIDLGARVTLMPRVPENAGLEECKVTQRVCFSPSLWQCLVGMVGTSRVSAIITDLFAEHLLSGLNPAIYMTQKKLHEPARVLDYGVTGEMWSVDPIQVTRVGYLDFRRIVESGQAFTTREQRHGISADYFQGWIAGNHIGLRAMVLGK